MTTSKKGVKADINITPYIDILLVLLIIFMCEAPMRPHEHKIRIPQAVASVKQVKQEEPIIVEMDMDKNVKLGDKLVPLNELESKLRDIFSKRGQQQKGMFIRGDQALPYGDVFTLLDIAKKSGAVDIALLDKGYEHGPIGGSKGSR
jgi:biopolymer transport protein TolR